MTRISRFKRSLLYVAIASGIAPLAYAQQGTILEEIIVTAQRKAESIQDVPVAVSAFSTADLEERRFTDARDLQTAVPNLSYTGSGVGGGEGFQIRGVGNSVGGTTGDVGVGIHRNNAPQVQSRIATAESFDMERVEVLRGPQGTLYGRNSTGGVINYITAKPTFEEFDFSATAEVGNYNSRKVKSMINIPMGEAFALRIAGISLERDGFTDNIDTGNDIDNRDIWSGRATFAFEPTDWLSGWVLYERFDEDDTSANGARSLCIKDAGPTRVGNTDVANADIQNYLSQGCAPGSIYSDAASANPNSVGTFGGRFARVAGVVPGGDLYANQSLPNDLRETSAYRDPSTDIQQEIVEFEINTNITDGLTLSLLGHSSEDQSYTQSGSYEGTMGFLDIPWLTPGGTWNDFQVGPAEGMRTLSINDYSTEQQSLELRLQSSFDGPINFNLGVLDLNVERDTHTFVSTNTTTLYIAAAECGGIAGIPTCPVYFDQNPVPDYTGHQYFDTWTPYELNSQAVFAELYADISDTLKLTVGLRYTDDEKERIRYLGRILQEEGVDGPGTGGYADDHIIDDKVDFQAETGRLVLDWMPDTDITDSTLIYASYSRGYKSGGFNSPEVDFTPPPYDPENVNAYEIGTKNTFAGGRGLLNASLFYYDYEDYQISKLAGLSVRNENIDAEVYGVELESGYEFFDSLQVNANLGWLETKVKNGESIDPMDRTNGDDDWVVLHSYAEGCIAPVGDVEAAINLVNANVGVPADAFFDGCSAVGPGLFTAVTKEGNPKKLKGNELPNSPSLSANLNLQYRWEMAGWDSSALLDYSWKDKSYTSVFNDVSYELDSWDNTNLSFNFSHYDMGLALQLYVKNVFDDDTIVNHSVGSDGVGLTRGLSLLDPRTYGLAVTYNFD